MGELPCSYRNLRNICNIFARAFAVTESAPKFTMNKEIKNYYDFTVDDFALEDYRFSTLGKKIEVAI